MYACFGGEGGVATTIEMAATSAMMHFIVMGMSWLFSVIFVFWVFSKIDTLETFTTPLWSYTTPFTENVGWSQTEASIMAEMNNHCTSATVDGSVAFLQEYNLPVIDPFCTCLAAEIGRRLSMPGLSVADAIAQLTANVFNNTPVFDNQRMEVQRCRMEMRQHIVPFEQGGVKSSNIVLLGTFWNIFSLIYIWKTMLDMLNEWAFGSKDRKYTLSEMKKQEKSNIFKWLFIVSETVFFIIAIIYFVVYNNNIEWRDLAFGLMVILYFMIAQIIFFYYELPHGISTISYMIILPCAVGIMLGASFQLEGVEYVTTLCVAAIIPICFMLMFFMPNFDVTTLSVSSFLVGVVIMVANASLIFPGNRGSAQYWSNVDAFWVWLTLWPLVFAPILYGLNIYTGNKDRDVKIRNRKIDTDRLNLESDVDNKITLTLLYCEFIPKFVVGIQLLMLVQKYTAPVMTIPP